MASVLLLSLGGGAGLANPSLAQAAVPTVASCASSSAAATGGCGPKLAARPALAPATPPGNCPAGLVAYWKLDETSGSTFVDSANGHDATCTTGCPIAATGVVSGALTFSSSTTTTVPADSAFAFGLADSFSVEIWIKMPSAGTCTPEPAIGRASPGVDLMQWWLGCDAGKAEFVVKDKDGNIAFPVSTTPVTDGNFHHLVGVRDAGANQLRLYVDGTLEDTKATTYTAGFDSASPIDLGWYKSSLTYHFTGDLDEAAIYNRVLTADEIAAHHTNGLAGHGICDVISAPTISIFLPFLSR